MKIYLISYDLSKPEQDYEGLINAIEKLDSPIHIQKSVWLIDTNFNCNQIYSILSPFLDKDDALFICPLDLGDVNCYSKDLTVKKWFEEHGFNLQTRLQ